MESTETEEKYCVVMTKKCKYIDNTHFESWCETLAF